MRPRDWLLVLCAYHGAPTGLDPIRVQKGMFLFSRSGGLDKDETYDFRPYDYGPMSARIYSDLDALVGEGLIEAQEVSGKSWSRYTATEHGRAAAGQLLAGLTGRDKTKATRLYEVKQRVAAMSFGDLLEQVYRDHPDMAVNSIFRRSR